MEAKAAPAAATTVAPTAGRGGSRIAAPSSGDARNAAYASAGDAVLDRCDVLVAVWDGKASQGEGGTAEVVARARARHIPIAWVHAGNRKPGTMEPTSLGPDQGKVTLEGL